MEPKILTFRKKARRFVDEPKRGNSARRRDNTSPELDERRGGIRKRLGRDGVVSPTFRGAIRDAWVYQTQA